MGNTKRKLASREPLSPGEHSVDRVTPREIATGTWRIDWSVCLPSGRVLHKQTQASTVTVARRRAKQTAANLLLAGGGERTLWSPSMKAEDFIQEEAVRSVRAAGLAPSTTRLYVTALMRVRAELRGLPLAEAATYGQLEAALQEVSEHYGLGAAKNAKKALTGHFIAPLLRHRLIDANPLAHRVDLVSMAKPAEQKPKGSAELTNADRLKVIDYLLQLDPAEGVPEKSRSRWSYAHRLRYRQNAITQCLLQASTGLRLQEAAGQAHEDIDANGWLTTTFPKPVRVGSESVRKPRTIPVLDPRVIAYIDAHSVEGSPWVLPSPADSARKWGSTAAKEAMADLYPQLAETLGIPPLQTLRSHAWRSTISAHLKAEGVPMDAVTAYLGHSEAVNLQSYTHGVDLGAVTALISGGVKTTV